MGKKIMTCVLVLVATIGILSAVNSSKEKKTVPENLVGNWKGTSRVIVSWCLTKSVSVEIIISQDGMVNGKFGDADIKSGKITDNHEMLKWLGNSPYIIDAELKGEIVAKEGIKRDHVKLLLRPCMKEITGGFHTSGTKFGGKNKMMMSGTDLRLKKIDD